MNRGWWACCFLLLLRTGLPAVGQAQGLVLKESEGERRMRRPRPTPQPCGDIAPGEGIAPHHHPFADEILLIHRGSGVATVGRREGAVSPGTTIYIPRDTRATLRNTGAEKMTIAFIFARPGIEQYFRETSVAEGQPARPFAPEEFAAVRGRHREHVTFDEP